MKNFKIFNSENAPSTSGSSLSGYLNTTYNKLIEKLGKPTFDSPSGDDKVQVEWVIEFEGDLYTIYDYKTYNREYTENELDKFNVGSKVNASSFIDYLEKLLNN
jgi:hypothetical protein